MIFPNRLYISFFLIISFGIFSPLKAQIQKVFHQTFEVSDSVEVISLNIVDPLDVESWAGNQILAEIKLEIKFGTPGILKFLLDSERYNLESERAGASLSLASKNPKRNLLKNKEEQIIKEIINIRLFVPDEYELTNTGELRRKK